jgi:hypothetical protein
MPERLLLEREEPNGRISRLYGDDVRDLEIYIDGAWGVTMTQHICKLNLYTHSFEFKEDNVDRREVAVRLVMPISVMFSMRDFFRDQCKRLEDQGGVIPGGTLSVEDFRKMSPKDLYALVEKQILQIEAPEKEAVRPVVRKRSRRRKK